MIRCQNIVKRYANGIEALSQINFHLGAGEMAFLTGHSGAGKSSLLKLITALEAPTQGQITIQQYNLKQLSAKTLPLIRRSMGIIFQDPMLLPTRTAFDNVALPLLIAGYHPQDIDRRVRAALDKVGLLNKEKMYPNGLSAGEQQRLSIARAVVHKPKLLIADEPTGNLDPDLSLEIMRIFEQFHQVGVSVLIATHDLSLVATMPHRVLYLHQGHLT